MSYCFMPLCLHVYCPSIWNVLSTFHLPLDTCSFFKSLPSHPLPPPTAYQPLSPLWHLETLPSIHHCRCHAQLQLFICTYHPWFMLGLHPSKLTVNCKYWTLKMQLIHLTYQISWLSLKWSEVKVAQSCPTPWDPMDCMACQAPLSMEFSRPESLSG